MSHPVVLLLARATDVAGDCPALLGRLSATDPFAAGRTTAFIDDDGVAAGTVAVSGALTISHYPFTEMLVVHRGQVTLTAEGQSLVLEPGQSAVIGRGTALQLDAQADALWAFCAATQASAVEQPGIVSLPGNAELSPSAAPEDSILIGPAPQCRSNNMFTDTTSPLRMGVWDSSPYNRRARPHKVHELMHVLEGEVQLKLEDGPSLTVKAGDTVFVPLGTPCAWVSTVYVRKFYCVG